MKAAKFTTRWVVCSVVFVCATLARAQPPQAPPRAPEMPAGWRAPPHSAPSDASAPRGNLRGDIENNAHRNDSATHPHSPPPR